MSDLIDRQAVLELIDHLDMDFANSFDPHTLNEIYRCLNELPSVENKGEWLLKCEFPIRWECSHCHTSSYELLNYCPNCGAYMRRK